MATRMIHRHLWLTAAVTLFVAAVLPLIGHTVRGKNPARCHWDGLPVDSVFRVRVATSPDVSYSFCCVLCAAAWIDRSAAAVSHIYVTDESSGIEVNAVQAFFVRSTVPTNAITGNRWHTFRTSADALRHADAARARVVSVTDSPLASASGLTDKVCP